MERDEAGRSGALSGGRPRWIYVAGDGRSGSTLLGSLLADVLGGFDCGELHLLWPSLVDGRLCTCGTAVAACDVWSKVAAMVRSDLGLRDDAEGAAISHGRLRQRQLLGPRLPPPLPEELALRRSTESAIEQVTGASVVVDSSKLSTVLWTAGHVDRPLQVVHLVRDPRATAFSWTQATKDPSVPSGMMDRKAVWRSSADWLRAHATIERVRPLLRDIPFARVRYEDLVVAPWATVEAIAGARPDDVVAFASDPGAHHAIAGNPRRFRRDQAIRADERWRTGMPGRQRAEATLLAAPLLRRYGYGLRAR